MHRYLLVSAPTHGRVIVRDVGEPEGLLVGFHGYMENAEIMMERLTAIPGLERWTLVSVQGLHRFYKGRSQEVVASWMTRQDREAAILDNIAYADNVVASTRSGEEPIVFTGFSQGVAMAFRAAVKGKAKASGVIAVGGDVPPELLADASSRFPRVLLTRGAQDDWYTADKMAKDVAALRARGEEPQSLTYEGGHEWTSEVAAAVGRFCGRA
jgi:predicted esterase